MSEEKKHSTITHQFMQAVKLSGTSRFDRFFVPALLMIGVLHAALQVLAADWLLAGISLAGALLLLAFAALQPLQKRILRRPFERSHAFYLAVFAVCATLAVWALRLALEYPPLGKDSRFFYVFLLILIAVTYRGLLALLALSPFGFRFFFSRIPLWEQVLVALNEFIAAGLLAFVLGGELVRWFQPDVFTLQANPLYAGGVLAALAAYYLIIQMMWVDRWNEWLSRNIVWVRLARLLAPVALVLATFVIARHFGRLSDPRTADLLDGANLDQTILAISPVVWLLIFFVCMLVYTGSTGLRQRFLPDRLLAVLPDRLRSVLTTVSDMDILLLFGVFATSIPLQLIVFEDEQIGLLDTLRLQIVQQNALIDSSEQALALLFSLPFYVLAVALLVIYSVALANPQVPARERDELVDRLPIGLVIVFIIALYLCAIPFSLVLSEGRLPQLPAELGRVLAFDVLIPLILLYSHYFVLVRIPYGRGQSLWRAQQSQHLERDLRMTDHAIESLQMRIQRNENLWRNRSGLRANPDERMDMLYQFIELNGERDRLNMERLRILGERQELQEISEAPISLAVAHLPTRVVSIGIPLLLAFKIYEWAVVNDGLREIANNPNIGVIEFFQIILQQTQF